jgi:hypothetical protein
VLRGNFEHAEQVFGSRAGERDDATRTDFFGMQEDEIHACAVLILSYHPGCRACARINEDVTVN